MFGSLRDRATFNPMKDERLRQIFLKAGMIAYFTYLIVAWLHTALRFSIDSEILNDPNVVFIFPWFTSQLVWMVIMIREGYFRSVRDENTRSAKLAKKARWSVVGGAMFFGAGMFGFSRIGLFGLELRPIEVDIIGGLLMALSWGGTMWFLHARKTRDAGE
jgi:hypothetical protein